MASVTLIFPFQFTASKAGKAGLSPTYSVVPVNRSTGVKSTALTGTCTEVEKGGYIARLTGLDPRTYAYYATATTTDTTVDQKEVPSFWTEYSPSALVALPDNPPSQINGLVTLVENDSGVVGVKMVMIANTPVTSSAVVGIDFADTVATRGGQDTAQTSLNTLTTRVPSTVHTAAQQTIDHAAELTAIGNVPGLVWASGTRTLTSFGTLVADVATAVWGSLTSGMTTAGSIGKWILDNLAGLARQTSVDDVAAQVEAVNSELIDQGTTLDAALVAAQSAATDAAGANTKAGLIQAILNGITSLPKWLRAGFRKDAPDATALAEINAGGGTYDPASDSGEALSEAVGGIEGGGSVGNGTGDTPVDHNTGGADTYRIRDAGDNGVDNATLNAYLKSEYDADPTAATLRGQTFTAATGRWVAPLMLDAGVAYTIVVSAPGRFVSYTFDVTP